VAAPGDVCEGAPIIVQGMGRLTHTSQTYVLSLRA
jgi:hypothetical protein